MRRGMCSIWRKEERLDADTASTGAEEQERWIVELVIIVELDAIDNIDAIDSIDSIDAIDTTDSIEIWESSEIVW